MFHTLVIGAGPAALSLLICAIHRGELSNLVSRGLAIVGSSHEIGSGDLRRYDILSDTRANTFLECLEGETASSLVRVAGSSTAAAVARYRDGPVPLPLAGAFLDEIGSHLERELRRAGTHFSMRCCAEAVGRLADGSWRVRQRREDGSVDFLVARNVVLAMGGEQPTGRIAEEAVGGVTLSPDYDGKLVFSGDLLTAGGRDRIVCALSALRNPRVAIVGGSHSAIASAIALLCGQSRVLFSEDSITILHRRPLRVYYPSVKAARADGYTEFNNSDVCTKTGAVFRLAGFRLTAREFVAAELRLGGRKPDPRVRFCNLSTSAREEVVSLLERADLVVAALGYRPRTIPISDESGKGIRLHANGSGARALVDQQCRIMDALCRPIPGLFGIGLSSGFIPSGEMGGEPSFVGQTNGLWLWQNDVGALLLSNLTETNERVWVS
jgi:hypothetical protein